MMILNAHFQYTEKNRIKIKQKPNVDINYKKRLSGGKTKKVTVYSFGIERSIIFVVFKKVLTKYWFFFLTLIKKYIKRKSTM